MIHFIDVPYLIKKKNGETGVPAVAQQDQWHLGSPGTQV